ncbi:MAG: DUF441 family protein [Bacillota bacterium]
MLHDNLLLIILLGLSLVAGNRLVGAAAGLLLLLSLLQMDAAITYFADRAIDLGLILLLVAILAPFAGGRQDWSELRRQMGSGAALAAVAGGMLATRLQGGGLALLEQQPHIILGLLIGTVLGVLFLGGIPVGPLTGAGLTALILWLFTRRWL